ncbi:hypothetical protein [Jiangella muralis]|uniref:hypothetical protein n=1 Tax=Jiangella muralis TaxID=702383 RepID=UPI0012F8CC46|nr:hypothetical protein [Jiangella muralis]
MTSLPRADAGLAAGMINTSSQLGIAFRLTVFTGAAAAHTGGLVDGFRTAFPWVAMLVVATIVPIPRGPGLRRNRR